MDKEYTFGEKCADKVASFGGSWSFIIYATIVIIGWMLFNSIEKISFDPAPYIGLNLVLSCVAAFQAPFILMSSNRQASLDRGRDIEDFELDKLTNAEVRSINRKIDYLIEKIKELEHT